MDALPFPDLLDKVSRAGVDGAPAGANPEFHRQMETCLAWGYNLKIYDGCVHLICNDDVLVPCWIEEESFSVAWDKLNVIGYLRIGSTNSEALERARRGAHHGTIVYAEEQTAGRGRRNRQWLSHARTGLFFSLILSPSQPRKIWPLLTHAASAALAETLKARRLNVDIKWPNDVLISGKKCAGILLETISEEDAAVVGVGINVHPGSVPENLAGEAVCLDEAALEFVPRRQVLTSFLDHFQKLYQLFERGAHQELLDRWKACSSMWKGVSVWIDSDRGRRSAVTCGLTEIGALLVRTPEGAVETVLAGDVSIRRGA
jgi:BirA family transcriptional regulator, biotin operon repressor / biotin---[acetyl-CoA-carboxylase] ligase